MSNRFSPPIQRFNVPTNHAAKPKWIETTREKTGGASDLELLQKTFDRMK
jgi:hypothetical protein